MKTLLNHVFSLVISLVMVAGAEAAVTNASWTFPSITTPASGQPIGADLSIYSTNDTLTWFEANSKLSESFVLNLGNTTALEFSYNGNHPEYLNDSTLTLTSTISDLPPGDSLVNVHLSYDTKWNMTASSLTDTWAYSINGGAFINFATNTITGNVWRTTDSPLSGLKLKNGDTLILRDTFSGASGNNGILEFDNFQITTVLVPEPSPLALASLGISLTRLRRIIRIRLVEILLPLLRPR